MAATSSSGTSGKASDNPGKDDLEAQLANLKADFAKLAETVGAIGAGKADELKGQASESVSEARRMSEDAVRAAERHARQIESDMAARVAERPFLSLGLAAGLGFLIALIARR